MRRIILVLMTLLFTGCAATGKNIIVSDNKAVGPKIVAIDGPRTPWLIEIENRLRQHGFKVLRWASQKHVKEKVTEGRVEEFNEASARYILSIDGYAPLDKMHRCFGGGVNFDYINAELIDAKNNETLVNISGSGYSENCPPMSGTIFQDIADAVNNTWSQK